MGSVPRRARHRRRHLLHAQGRHGRSHRTIPRRHPFAAEFCQTPHPYRRNLRKEGREIRSAPLLQRISASFPGRARRQESSEENRGSFEKVIPLPAAQRPPLLFLVPPFILSCEESPSDHSSEQGSDRGISSRAGNPEISFLLCGNSASAIHGGIAQTSSGASGAASRGKARRPPHTQERFFDPVRG